MSDPYENLSNPRRLPPLKTSNASQFVSHRRMSSSWTDNLDTSKEVKLSVTKALEIKSPTENKPHQFFFKTSAEQSKHVPSNKETIVRKISQSSESSRTKSDGLDKDREKEDKSEKSEKKLNRRESIKDHLLKFKIKAGKVLEEVHDRLVEDHSSSVAPLSPSIMIASEQPSTELEDIVSQDERVKSPTLSQSSKRTSNSAELKASMRSKIRKQAEKAVERTRGSVQLTRRLQRRLTSHMEDAPSENDFKTVDEQIENSLKIGERFLLEQPSIYPPDDVQMAFFTDIYESEDKETPPIGPLVMYRKAEPAPDVDPAIYLFYEGYPQDVETGGSIQSIFPNIAQRYPSSFLISKSNESMPIRKLTKDERSKEDVYAYIAAEPWKNYIQQMSKNDYIQMDIVFNAIYFDHHYLCNEEDSSAIKLKKLYNEQLQKMQEMASVLKELDQGKNWSDQSGSSTGSIRDCFDSLNQGIQQTAEYLRNEWANLEDIRNRQGYSTTTIKYAQTVPEELSWPLLGEILYDNPLTPIKAIPVGEKQRIDMIKKTSIYLILYFNEIFVCKTKAFALIDFVCNIKQCFSLEILSEPKLIKATVVEKCGSNERILGKIAISPPCESDSMESLPPFQQVYFENDKLMEKLDFMGSCTSCDFFSMIPTQVRLASDEEFEANLRWDVLDMRNNRRFANTSDLRRIGIDSSEIDPSLLLSGDRKMTKRYRTSIDGQRAAGNMYAVMIRTKLLERHSEFDRARTYDEIVNEEPIPTIFAAFGSICSPPDISRKLKPMRKEVARQQTSVTAGCNVILNVQSAINLPVRSDGSLQPLVEAVFQNSTTSTGVVIGRNPNWQQSLSLSIDRAPSTDLRTIMNCLYINVYDQIVSPLNKDDREQNTIHEQLLRRLIGTVSIPFSTIYCRGKVDGFLKIHLPLFLTGYRKEKLNYNVLYVVLYSLSDRSPYIKVLITIDPPLLPPRTVPMITSESVESGKILSQCHLWAKSCRSLFDSRRYAALVTNVNGKSILGCRFVRPIRAPPVVEQFSANPLKAVETAARIVSYIPFLADPLLFPGSCDVWTTLEQFVAIGCGDEEEHAILLCCWLLSIHLPSYIVLGTALPEGEKAAYVLTYLPQSIFLLNPCDGQLLNTVCISGSVYNIDDAMCPFQSLGTVISSTNVFANIQRYSHPSQLTYDFTRSSDWRPVFEKDFDTLESCQPAAIAYTEVREYFNTFKREELLIFFCLYVGEKLSDIYNKYGKNEHLKKGLFDLKYVLRCISIKILYMKFKEKNLRLFREILQEFENNANFAIDDRLSRLKESYMVTATALRIPYRNLQSCVDAVLKTHLHVNTDPGAQFALAVHVQPYFNNIVSCSIAVALLTLKKFSLEEKGMEDRGKSGGTSSNHKGISDRKR
uniref:C2 domain-containing protein n=1 Tax=Heterorhabditis bacteriophora TaxID=37862 RepID=A0A1I7XGA4_HETBA